MEHVQPTTKGVIMGIFDNYAVPGGLLGGMADPQTQGLLGAAIGLLGASGPSRTPVSLGQAMGQGLQGMQQSYNQALQLQRENALRELQMKQAQLGLKKTESEMAEKERPKVKDWQKVNVGGQVLYAPYFEDGSVGQPVPYAVAEKLHFANTGGETVALDPFTGQRQAGMKNTQSPESVASNALGWANNALSRQRLALEQSNADRLQHVNVDNQPMTFNPKTGRFDVGIGPDGKPLPQTAKPLTEAQAKDNLFGTRAREADKILSTMEAKGVQRPGGIKTAAEQTGRILGLGTETFGGALSDTLGSATNWTQSAPQQQVDQARRDFLNAVLRKESGAVISSGEFANAEKQYFPQMGDSKQVLEQKARNRQTAIQGILAGVPGGPRGTSAPQATPNKTASAIPSGWTVTEK